MSKTFLFVGSCNQPTSSFASSNGRGISTYIFDQDSGHLEPVAVADDVDNPTFLTISADGQTLYANSEMSAWANGIVSAYKVDQATGVLELIGRQSTLGNTPAQMSLDRSGRFLFVANYGLDDRSRQGLSSSISVLPVRSNGSLDSAFASVIHSGQTGPRPDRQDGPHPHAALPSPNNRFLVASDLGLDRLFVYRFDDESGAIRKIGSAAMPPGSGPRHFVFSPAGDAIYAVNELNSTVASLSFDPVEGNLAVVAIVPAILGEGSNNHCSEIQLSRDGRFLFVANRGDDSLSIFRVGQAGQLPAPERVPCGGRTPRHFAFDPSGKFVAVANQDSDRISIFAMNEPGLRRVCDVSEGTPTCLCFAP